MAPRRKYHFDECFFDVIDSEPNAYFFGLLAADGWIKKDGRWYLAVALELKSDDRHIVEELRDALGDPHVPVVTRPANATSPEKAKVIFFSAPMAQTLAHRYGDHKTFSLGALSHYIPSHLTAHFVRGVFDGDGCWADEEYRLRFTVRGTIEFLQDLQSCIPVDTFIGGRGTWKTLMSSKHQDAVTFGHWMYDNATLYLERKHTTFSLAHSRNRSRRHNGTNHKTVP
jgi:hypothetical protein